MSEPQLSDSPVDVVIATRGDRDEMLAQALTSVLDQDYPGPIHVTVVYDGAEPPLHPVRQQDDALRTVTWVWNSGLHGLARARNLGAASGDRQLLCFLDDDDLWEREKLTAQVALLQARPEIPLVGTGIRILDASGRRTARPAPRVRISHEDLLGSRVAELHPSSFVMRRDAFDLAGGIDEELPGSYAEDYDLLLRMSRAADLGMVPSPLTLVRWTGGSYFFSRWQTIAEALEYLLRKHPDLAAHPRGSARIQGQIAFARAAMHQRRLAWQAMRSAMGARAWEPRIALAGLVTAGVSADRIQGALHRLGRGI